MISPKVATIQILKSKLYNNSCIEVVLRILQAIDGFILKLVFIWGAHYIVIYRVRNPLAQNYIPSSMSLGSTGSFCALEKNKEVYLSDEPRSMSLTYSGFSLVFQERNAKAPLTAPTPITSNAIKPLKTATNIADAPEWWWEISPRTVREIIYQNQKITERAHKPIWAKA